MNLNQVKPGESIWLYIVEYTEECFPIVEKEYVLADKSLGGNGSWVKLRSVDSGKEERRVINNFDYGVSANSCNRLYIWLSEKNLRRAFGITKEYFMDKLTKSTREVSRLCGIFSNMEGWIDIFKEEDEFMYNDDDPIDVYGSGKEIDLEEVEE